MVAIGTNANAFGVRNFASLLILTIVPLLLLHAPINNEPTTVNDGSRLRRNLPSPLSAHYSSWIHSYYLAIALQTHIMGKM
jgi:hypothetical protein